VKNFHYYYFNQNYFNKQPKNMLRQAK